MKILTEMCPLFDFGIFPSFELHNLGSWFLAWAWLAKQKPKLSSKKSTSAKSVMEKNK